MLSEDLLGRLADASEFLGAFFLLDPLSDTARAHPYYAALCSADPHEIVAAWFSDSGSAGDDKTAPPTDMTASLAEMISCAAEGLDPQSALSQEYQRLFVGPYPSPAPPYGSVYTDHDMVLFGHSTSELKAWMRQEGISWEEKEGLPPDHIGTLLTLVAWCCDHKPECVCDLLSRHVLSWAFHYFELLESAANHPFFIALARLSHMVYTQYEELLALDVERPYFYR